MPFLIRSFLYIVACLGVVSIGAQRVCGLGEENFGPAGEHIGRSSDWPKGVENLLRHPSRVYGRWVNGNDQVFYDGDIEAVNQLLDLFSKVDLKTHQVVIRTGRPDARSFQGKVTPYVVQLELPAGIYLHHVQQYATTGLFSTVPRLTVHFDESLVEFLNALRVPPNVSLRALPYRVEDALAQIDVDDGPLLHRAISILGELGVSSPNIVTALERLSTNDDEHIGNAAENALAGIQQANVPSAKQLRLKIDTFLEQHPQKWRIPSSEELLDELREIDARYAEGFLAKGTMIESSTATNVTNWTVAMGMDRLVLRRRTAVDEGHPPAQGDLEYTIFVSPDRMGTIRQSRLWVDGKLIDTKPHTSFEPVGSTYDLLIGRVLWPLGRGFSRRLERITGVETQADGTLGVNAESNHAGLQLRWELRIDPSADYLVRHAKAYHRDSSTPAYIVDNAGVVLSADGCSIAHTARWSEGPVAQPVSIAVNSVSAKIDTELIRETEARLK